MTEYWIGSDGLLGPPWAVRFGNEADRIAVLETIENVLGPAVAHERLLAEPQDGRWWMKHASLVILHRLAPRAVEVWTPWSSPNPDSLQRGMDATSAIVNWIGSFSGPLPSQWRLGMVDTLSVFDDLATWRRSIGR